MGLCLSCGEDKIESSEHSFSSHADLIYIWILPLEVCVTWASDMASLSPSCCICIWNKNDNNSIIIAVVGEDVEKREFFCIVGGNVDWCSYYGK